MDTPKFFSKFSPLFGYSLVLVVFLEEAQEKKIINKKEIDNLAAAFILEGALQYISNYTDD